MVRKELEVVRYTRSAGNPIRWVRQILCRHSEIKQDCIKKDSQLSDSAMYETAWHTILHSRWIDERDILSYERYDDSGQFFLERCVSCGKEWTRFEIWRRTN